MADDIAVISMSCRFPAGANSPEAFWENMLAKVDAIGRVPPERFNVERFYDTNAKKIGQSYTDKGGFVDWDPALFDPTPFRISPREAAYMDPQQRLLLEECLTLFRRAGYSPEAFAGSDTGVFIGGFTVDHLLLRLGTLNRDNIQAHTATGSSLTMLANRVSHVFDLRGPSFTVDTACSSSLVAMHQGIQSLQAGDCPVAIVGGVNVIMAPEYYIVMSKGHFLSPNGRCASFDEGADGYVRGEGCGMVLLKPLKAAIADKDPILATIAGSGVNQDGRTRGITLPNKDSQESLLRTVMQKNGISTSEITYVEAHGTGTQAGDYAEASALHSVLADGRTPDDPLLVGSVKSHIGHLEAGAGIAGVIKSLLVLQHGEVPANLHYDTPNPKLPWDRRCKVVAERQPLPATDKPPCILVNSFGYGGTNGMVLLRRYSSAPFDVAEEPAEMPVPVSGWSAEGVSRAAVCLAQDIERGEDSLYDILGTHASAASDAPVRDLLWYRKGASIAADLRNLEPPSQGKSDRSTQRLAFVYSGMGPHWWGMGRELFQTEPVYRDLLKQIDRSFEEEAGFSFIEAMGDSADTSHIGKTHVDQPAGFGLQTALTGLLRHRGIHPDCVIGHSLGEVAALHAAGYLSLHDAVRVVYHRSRLQATLAGNGGMLATALDGAGAEELAAQIPGLDIAAVNSANMITFAGASADLDRAVDVLGQRKVFCRRLRVEIAYHSRQMAEIEAELADCLKGVVFQEPEIPLFSSVTGALFESEMDAPTYWRNNVRQQVRFRDGVSAMLYHANCDVLEIGPHPVLTASIRDVVFETQKATSIAHSLEREAGDAERLRDLFGTLYRWGHNPDWESWYAGRRVASLTAPEPTREHRWIETDLSKQYRHGSRRFPFASRRVDVPGFVWHSDVSGRIFPWLNDHVFRGTVAFPGAGYVAAFLECLSQARSDAGPLMLRDIAFHSLWLLNDRDNFELFTSYDAQSGKLEVSGGLRSKPHQQVLQASGWLSATPVEDSSLPQHRELYSADAGTFYEASVHRGLDYGPCFRVLDAVSVGNGTIRATLAGAEMPEMPDTLSFVPLLDGALHATLGALLRGDGSSTSFVPVRIGHLQYTKTIPRSAMVNIAIRDRGIGNVVVDIDVDDGDRGACLLLRNVEFTAIPAAQRDLVGAYIEKWTPCDPTRSEKGAPGNIEDIPLTGTDLQADRRQFDALLFERLIPALTAPGDGKTRLIVEQSEKGDGALVEMCTGLVNVADKELPGGRLSLVYGPRSALRKFETVWRDAGDAVLRVTEEGCFRPAMQELETGPIETVPAAEHQQVYFDWPIAAGRQAAGEMDCDLESELTAATNHPVLGWYIACLERGNQNRIAFVRKPDRRFFSGDGDGETDFRISGRDCFAEHVTAVLGWAMKSILPRAGAVLVLGNHPILDAVLAGCGLAVTDDPRPGDMVLRLSGDLPADLPEGLLIVDAGIDPLIAGTMPVWRPDLAKLVVDAQEKGEVQLPVPASKLAESLWTPIDPGDFKVTPIFSFNGEAVLVAGGTGGFGYAFAKWALQKGAGRVVVLGRSGALKDAAAEPPAGLEMHKADICNEEDVRAFFDAEKDRANPVRHIFHTAAVLDDRKIGDLDEQSYRTVLGPKADGGHFLDKYSRGMEISQFVMFSSVTSALGNSDQAAYAVANRVLESIVRDRNGEGLPGLAVQWGPIGDAGLVARDPALKGLLASRGMDTISSDEAFARLEHELLAGRNGVIAVYRTTSSVTGDAAGTTEGKWQELKECSVQDRRLGLEEISVPILAGVLKRPQDDFPTETPLSELGLDSLLAVEALLEYERVLGIRVPMPLFLGHLSLSEICAQIARLEPPSA